MVRSEVLFIGGRSGVGKSAAAEALHDLLVAADVRHVVIEGDALDLAHPAPHVEHPEAHLAERNLATMWERYRSLGHRRLIYTNTSSVLHLDVLTAAMGDEPLATAVLLRAGDAASPTACGVGPVVASPRRSSRTAPGRPGGSTRLSGTTSRGWTRTT